MAEASPEPAERLRQARAAAGFRSARAATTKFGWKYESYTQHENGTRGIGRAAGRYARAFKVSEAWLLTGTGPGPGEHAEAISLLTKAYRDAPPEMRAHLLREAENILLAAEALRRREEDEKDREDREVGLSEQTAPRRHP